MQRIRKVIQEIREIIAYVNAVKKIIFEKDEQGYNL